MDEFLKAPDFYKTHNEKEQFHIPPFPSFSSYSPEATNL
jgi:hypothetical protein